jgi:septal ring factor EnvC (AmiA/AmiB activator)
MDDAKYVWWSIMSKENPYLVQQLYEYTEKLVHQVQKINPNMETEQEVQLQTLTDLIDQRGEIINKLEQLFQGNPPKWSTIEREKIKTIEEWEKLLQPKLNEIYQSFANQIKKLQHGKQMSKRYHENYNSVYTDGAYFDKRK